MNYRGPVNSNVLLLGFPRFNSTLPLSDPILGMNPADELSALYAQWRSLTEEEGDAIESGAWPQVEHYQSAKSRLQPRIVEVSQRLEAAVMEHQFRAVVEELMALERRNAARLRETRRSAEQEKLELDKTSRNLRQIHRSYVPPARAHWQSYS